MPGADAHKALDVSRAHWGLENRLHWYLDVTFGEDRANVRLRSLAENFSVIRRLAMDAGRMVPTFNGERRRPAAAPSSAPLRGTPS